jgi:ribosomal protein L18E
MAQISLYIPEELFLQLREKAEQSHVSISKWVAQRIERELRDSYPIGFSDLAGSLAKNELIEPDRKSFGDDAAREVL